MSTEMRSRAFKTKLGNSIKSFQVLSKNLSARDVEKLKSQLLKYTKILGHEKSNTAALIYVRLMSAVYEKQLVGMGKLNNEAIIYRKKTLKRLRKNIKTIEKKH